MKSNNLEQNTLEDRPLNEHESVEIISRMIRNTQSKLTKNSAIPFLAWGYATVITTLAVWFALKTTENYYWNFLWFAIPLIGTPFTIWSDRKERNKGITTYIDRIIGYVWMVLGIACFVPSALCIIGIAQIHILFTVLLLMGAGAALTGLIAKFKMLTICGFIGLALSFCQFFVPGTYHFLVFAGAFLIMMVIPGHTLLCLASKNV